MVRENFYHWLGERSERLPPYHEWRHIEINCGDGTNVRHWMPRGQEIFGAEWREIDPLARLES